MIQDALARLLDGKDLTREESREVMDTIMSGEATPAQIGGFLVALRLKGETAEEIAGAAEAMRAHVVPVHPKRDDLVDTAGTGGDGGKTFNISTAAALVAAAAGAGVAEARQPIGVIPLRQRRRPRAARLRPPTRRPNGSPTRSTTLGFGFMFAPTHHPAMKHAGPVRNELAARTVFNVLGPLTNPAGARAQVVGVYSPALVPVIADVLARLGARRAFVVHGAGGIDELSPVGPNLVCEVVNGDVPMREIDPEELGVAALRSRRAARRHRRRERSLHSRRVRRRERRPPLRDPAERRRGDRSGRPRGRSARGSCGRPRGSRLGRRGRAARTAGRVLAGAGMRFQDALAAPGFGAIAEFKRRSPSAGDLRPDGDVAAVAESYDAAGARAMSILVDARFGGSLDDLRAARAATRLPLLAKGFFSAPGQLRELRDGGADAALLILRDLDDITAAELLREAQALGLDTLVEAHNADEVARAVGLDAPVIGINARDLGTFRIDRRAQLRLACMTRRATASIIAESAIESRAQAAEAELAGAQAVLVGSALMRADDPGARLAELTSRPLVKVCGLTRQDDVDAAVAAGADLVGFILADESPRRAEAVLDAPDTVLRVAVLVGEQVDTGADLVQLYAREDGHRARDAVLLRAGERVGTVVDLPWEQPDETHIDRARSTPGRVMLAGGLGPENVAAAIAAVRPWAVDSARSTESSTGIKDHRKLQAWIEAAR